MHAKFDHSIFSRSEDMVVAYKNFNGSRDLTTPLSGIVCHPWASTCHDQPIYTKFEVSVFTRYEEMNCDTKYRQWVGFG